MLDFWHPHRQRPVCVDLALDEINRHALRRTDINEHLPIIYDEAMRTKPKLIVELGVRGGESTFVFERVAKQFGAKLVSVDINNCLKSCMYDQWLFVQESDIVFAKRFKEFARQHKFDPSIDLLFIDTSHLYEHTVEEIRLWFPYLSAGAKVIFHDTNMGLIYRRKDGSKGAGWNNDRGVIRAIEDYLHVSLDERYEFVTNINGWTLRHIPTCSGLTILDQWCHPTTTILKKTNRTNFSRQTRQ